MEDFIKEWGYIALFAYSFGGGFVGLIVAGVLSFAGDLNIYICIAVAATSNFLGDQFLFFLARKNKSYAKDMMKNYGRKIALAHHYDEKIWFISCVYPKIYLWNKNINSACNGINKIFFT